MLPNLAHLSLSVANEDPTSAGGPHRRHHQNQPWRKHQDARGWLPRATPFLDKGQREGLFSLIEDAHKKVKNAPFSIDRDNHIFKDAEKVLSGWRGKTVAMPDSEIYNALYAFHVVYLAPVGVGPDPMASRVTPDDIVNYYYTAWTRGLWEVIQEGKTKHAERRVSTQADRDRFFGLVESTIRRLNLDTKTWAADKRKLDELIIGRGDDRLQRFAAGTSVHEFVKQFHDKYLKQAGVQSSLQYFKAIGPEQLLQVFNEWLAELERIDRVGAPGPSGA